MCWWTQHTHTQFKDTTILHYVTWPQRASDVSLTEKTGKVHVTGANVKDKNNVTFLHEVKHPDCGALEKHLHFVFWKQKIVTFFSSFFFFPVLRITLVYIGFILLLTTSLTHEQVSFKNQDFTCYQKYKASFILHFHKITIISRTLIHGWGFKVYLQFLLTYCMHLAAEALVIRWGGMCSII